MCQAWDAEMKMSTFLPLEAQPASLPDRLCFLVEFCTFRLFPLGEYTGNLERVKQGLAQFSVGKGSNSKYLSKYEALWTIQFTTQLCPCC